MDEDDAENGEQGEDSKEANDDEEDFDEEPIEKLLEPFGKDQLVVLIKEGVSKYPNLMESVHKLADADPAHRKIFVHGLGWDANAETLTSEFGKTGAKKALKEPQKKIGSRMTSCQLASAGPVPAPPPTAPPVSEYTQRKIFVSNVSAEIDPQKLLEFFFQSVEGSKKALEEPHKTFEGHTLHCQKAVDGPKPGKPFYQQHHQQYHPHSSRKEKGRYSSGGGAGTGHLMAPSGPSMGFNPAVAAPALTPALGQALTALLASQGAGLGIARWQLWESASDAGWVSEPTDGQGTGRPPPGAGAYMGHGH
ncbi:UBP1-associated protein 2A [Actinidia rufa]|uniref:UBP1-associated protein 2A n=1 Tax=Actinidia rufa TaxID=165716 RepID=A0A7J0H4W8_9ERIC|nr:UBP1-associated protein 2A [Actinidia rufa]